MNNKLKKTLASLLVTTTTLVFVTFSYAASKYDYIKSNPEWLEELRMWNNNNSNPSNQAFIDYTNLLVNTDDVIRLAKNGKLTKEKSKFILENYSDFTKYLQRLAWGIIHKENNLKDVTELEIIYITGVIKDPTERFTMSGPDYEMKKLFFYRGGFVTYRNWEKWRNQEFQKKCVDVVFETFEEQKKR